jgi:hypothetical protein
VDSEKCNLLNEYFCSITDLHNDDIILPDFDDGGLNIVSDIVVVTQYTNIILLLDNNKEAGSYKYSFNKLHFSESTPDLHHPWSS